MLMQAYRRGFEADGRRGRLSQEGLLQLMGQVDPRYLERYNHSTVARWESGATRPTRERLEVFGKALQLPTAEIDGMIRLAGLDEEPGPAPDNGPEQGEVENGPGHGSEDTRPALMARNSEAVAVVRYVLTKVALPSLVVVSLGYMLARLGWNAGWLMALYVGFAVGLVLVMGFLKLSRTHELREVYFISVFFLMSSNLLQAPSIRMDPYGFYAIEGMANTPVPYLLSMVVNLLVAMAAGLSFDFLWRWQYLGSSGFSNLYLRAAWTAFPPLALVYVFAMIFCCLGSLVFLLLVFAIMGGTFTVILVLRDPEMKVTPWEKRVLLQAAIGICLVLTAVGGASIFILYLQPSLLAIPDHTLLRSWEIDFNALGYPADELLERYRFGAVWSSLATVAYMVIVLGGSLLVSIRGVVCEEPSAPVDVIETD